MNRPRLIQELQIPKHVAIPAFFTIQDIRDLADEVGTGSSPWSDVIARMIREDRVGRRVVYRR